MPTIIWLMYATIVVYNIVDYFQTRALNKLWHKIFNSSIGFGIQEANPLMAWVITTGGIESLLYVKIGLMILLGVLLARYTYTKRRIIF